MTEFAAIFLLLAIVMAIGTLAAVLLVRFWMPGSGRRTRVLTAAAAGPIAVVVPIMTYVLFEDPADIMAGLIGTGFVLAMAFAIIGYPISHFATRKLGRLTHFEASTFE